MSAIEDGIFRIRNHEPSGMVAAENLAQAMERELATMRAELYEKSACIEHLIKENVDVANVDTELRISLSALRAELEELKKDKHGNS